MRAVRGTLNICISVWHGREFWPQAALQWLQASFQQFPCCEFGPQAAFHTPMATGCWSSGAPALPCCGAMGQTFGAHAIEARTHERDISDGRWGLFDGPSAVAFGSVGEFGVRPRTWVFMGMWTVFGSEEDAVLWRIANTSSPVMMDALARAGHNRDLHFPISDIRASFSAFECAAVIL